MACGMVLEIGLLKLLQHGHDGFLLSQLTVAVPGLVSRTKNVKCQAPPAGAILGARMLVPVTMYVPRCLRLVSDYATANPCTSPRPHAAVACQTTPVGCTPRTNAGATALRPERAFTVRTIRSWAGFSLNDISVTS